MPRIRPAEPPISARNRFHGYAKFELKFVFKIRAGKFRLDNYDIIFKSSMTREFIGIRYTVCFQR